MGINMKKTDEGRNRKRETGTNPQLTNYRMIHWYYHTLQLLSKSVVCTKICKRTDTDISKLDKAVSYMSASRYLQRILHAGTNDIHDNVHNNHKLMTYIHQ